jgi:hypothetical protein
MMTATSAFGLMINNDYEKENIIKRKVIEMQDYLNTILKYLEDEYENLLMENYSSNDTAMIYLRNVINIIELVISQAQYILDNMDKWMLLEFKMVLEDFKNLLEICQTEFNWLYDDLLYSGYSPEDPVMKAIKYAMDGLEESLSRMNKILDMLPQTHS